MLIGTAISLVGCGMLSIGTVAAFIFGKRAEESVSDKLNRYFRAANISSNNGFINGDKVYARVIKEIEPNKAYLISVPYGRTLKDFKVDAIKMIVGDLYDIDIRWFNSGVILLELIKEMSEKFPRLIKYETNEESEKFPCPITIDLGKDINGDIIKLNLSDNPHSYIVGCTGAGKSSQLRIILLELITKYCSMIELYLIDLKIVELALFKKYKCTKEFITDGSKVETVLTDLLEECRRRCALFESVDVVDIKEYNKRVDDTDTLKYKVVVIEEYAMIYDNKKAVKLLKKLIAIGRSCGILIIITVQRPDCFMLDAFIKANIANRITFRTMDTKNSIITIDSEGAELLNTGEALIRVGSDLIKYKSYYISTTELKQILKPYIKPKNKVAPPSNKEPNDTIVRSDSNSKIVIDNNDDIDLNFLDNL